jgi:uncharacterized protein (DUF302 family)
MSDFGSPAYGLTRHLSRVPYERAVAAVRDALAAQGFGVLTEIDVQATLKKKLEVDIDPYVILGACNPQLAHRALAAEPGIGLLLPCNVVVTAAGAGSVVSIADPRAMLQVVGHTGLEPVVEEARSRLAAALQALASE